MSERFRLGGLHAWCDSVNSPLHLVMEMLVPPMGWLSAGAPLPKLQVQDRVSGNLNKQISGRDSKTQFPHNLALYRSGRFPLKWMKLEDHYRLDLRAVPLTEQWEGYCLHLLQAGPLLWALKRRSLAAKPAAIHQTEQNSTKASYAHIPNKEKIQKSNPLMCLQ